VGGATSNRVSSSVISSVSSSSNNVGGSASAGASSSKGGASKKKQRPAKARKVKDDNKRKGAASSSGAAAPAPSAPSGAISMGAVGASSISISSLPSTALVHAASGARGQLRRVAARLGALAAASARSLSAGALLAAQWTARQHASAFDGLWSVRRAALVYGLLHAIPAARALFLDTCPPWIQLLAWNVWLVQLLSVQPLLAGLVLFEVGLSDPSYLLVLSPGELSLAAFALLVVYHGGLSKLDLATLAALAAHTVAAMLLGDQLVVVYLALVLQVGFLGSRVVAAGSRRGE
jgi:hypothetical protein